MGLNNNEKFKKVESSEDDLFLPEDFPTSKIYYSHGSTGDVSKSQGFKEAGAIVVPDKFTIEPDKLIPGAKQLTEEEMKTIPDIRYKDGNDFWSKISSKNYSSK